MSRLSLPKLLVTESSSRPVLHPAAFTNLVSPTDILLTVSFVLIVHLILHVEVTNQDLFLKPNPVKKLAL